MCLVRDNGIAKFWKKEKGYIYRKFVFDRKNMVNNTQLKRGEIVPN
jgi:hypothetical protein